ncbi:MAG: metallophosphoesterase [Bacillota bacterium]|nr:metallophosphoesterase [Bacillota bacterium]
MKILLIGDTHGKLNRVRDIWPKLTNIDLIAHTGDHYSDAQKLAKELAVPVIAVGGNCDGSGPDRQIIETEYGRILLTHGHREGVKYDLNILRYRAMEEDCRAVFYGHTHQSSVIEADGMHFVNPGSLTLPRDQKSGSYAVVRTAEDRFDAAIVYYDTIMGKKSSPSSGFLKSILNYSDRF